MKRRFLLSDSELQTELLRQLNETGTPAGEGRWVLAGGIDPRGAAGDLTRQAEHPDAAVLHGDKTSWRVDGSCASFDGKHLAVKTDFDVEGGGFRSGPIRIFKHDGRQWAPDYEIKQEGFYETFLRGGSLVAQHYDGVRIFKHGKNGWVVEQKLLDKDWLPGADITNRLQVLSLADGALLLTSRGYDFIRILGRGADGWVLEQEIEKKHCPRLDLANKVSRFTQLASLSGDHLAIADTEAGTVYVFHKSTGGWVLERKITKEECPLLRMPAKNEDGGYPQLSVALSGNVLAVGASGFNAVCVFRKATAGWKLEQELTEADLGASAPRGKGLGGSVAIRGGVLVAVASRPEEAAFIFERTGNGAWVLAQEISNAAFPAIWQGKPQFGKPPAVADDGTVMIKTVQSIRLFKRRA
ncbi:hypothetical protein F4X86_01860 [Candidatus Saccharibacteria bacterium]|nr:hypothetical protein [Candidatus Saccharibacteria bacterium]